jgi:beta-galactosidase/beta-glucuronidase
MVASALAVVAVLLSTGGVAQAPPAVPRGEPPRPDRFRAEWQTLNGPWELAFDDADRGLAERWYSGAAPFPLKITVPFCFQSRASGVGDTDFHDVVWYRRAFTVPEAWRGRRLLVHFGAVDYEAWVWVNGQMVGHHRGGHSSFSLDVTDALAPADNRLVVRVLDPGADLTIPRGKQYWKRSSAGIFYTRTTGIWQPVWMEPVDAVHVASLRITPDIDRSQADVEVIAARPATSLHLRATARFAGEDAALAEVACHDTSCRAVLTLAGQKLWSPERPNLYDLTLELLTGGKVVDRVESYFGQRTIAAHNGRVYLNNDPYELRFALDQGYWPESLLTPPSDEAIKADIDRTKEFGLNGVRKHQKVEDPRWLYWADRTGLLVWGEMANAYRFSEDYVARFTAEWQEAVARDYNHPAIIAWVPVNESWGVPDVLTNSRQQAHLEALYQLTRSLDATRLVVDNDGWEHTDSTDLFTLHDYARTGDELAAKYKVLETDRAAVPRNSCEALVFGRRYNGTPFLLTEFGGVAFRPAGARAASEKEWGYAGVEATEEAFLTRLAGLVKAVRSSPVWAGYCYTQLTDVEQEINGLMTFDRRPKVDPARYRAIFAP